MTLPDAWRRPGLTKRFSVFQRKGHPRGSTPFTLDGVCAAEHFVVSPEDGGIVGATDRLLAKPGRTRQVACSLPSFLLAPALVASSDLVSMIPARLAILHGALIRCFDPPFPSPQFSVDILWHTRRRNDPAHVWIRTLLSRPTTDF